MLILKAHLCLVVDEICGRTGNTWNERVGHGVESPFSLSMMRFCVNRVSYRIPLLGRGIAMENRSRRFILYRKRYSISNAYTHPTRHPHHPKPFLLHSLPFDSVFICLSFPQSTLVFTLFSPTAKYRGCFSLFQSKETLHVHF